MQSRDQQSRSLSRSLRVVLRGVRKFASTRIARLKQAIHSARDVFTTSHRLFLLLWAHRETRWKLGVLSLAILVTGVVDYLIFFLIGKLSETSVLTPATVPGGQMSILAIVIFAGLVLLKVIGFTSRTADFVGTRLLRLDEQRIFDELITRAISRADLGHLLEPESRDRLNRVNEEGRSHLVALVENQVNLLGYVIELLAGIFVMFWYKWWLVALPGVAAYQILRVLLQYSRSSWNVARATTRDETIRSTLTGVFLDVDASMEVRSLGAADLLLSAATATNTRIAVQLEPPQRQLLRAQRGIAGLMFLSLVAVVVVLGIEYQAGRLPFAELLFLFLTTYNFFDTVEKFSDEWADQAQRMAAAREVLDTVDMGPSEEWEGGVQISDSAGPWAIEFRNVSFQYPETDRPGRRRKFALRRVSFVLEPGQRYVLLGGNGSGKSTLFKLLLGIFRPTEGEILVNGIPLMQLDLNWWRRNWRTRFQNGAMLPVTLRENIALGDTTREATDSNVRDALRQVHWERVEDDLPDGLDTVLCAEVGGHDLSGGQLQRVMLARTFFRLGAPYSIFDEPCNHLEPGVADAVANRIFEEQGVTSLVISHRQVDVAKADQVLIFKGGRLVASGSPLEVATTTPYMELFDRPLGPRLVQRPDPPDDNDDVAPSRDRLVG
ncbi:MAG: ABC transporter ATP-binding protein [Deltaproteobacteria bacterium]|nr:ABC transporter ATP-binding protein [Deltaproteobacteria bacterium]